MFFNNFFSKRFQKIICTTTLIVIISTGMVLPCQAANFAHSHTGSCYGEVWAPCTSLHQGSTRNTSSSAHCGNCKKSTPHTLYVNWDHCFGDGQDYEQGGRSQCNQCGATNYTWGGSGTGGHETLQNKIICGKDNAATGALSLKNLTPQWTTGTVTLQADIIRYSSDLSLPAAPYSWDTAGAWTTTNTKQVSNNGTYTVFAREAGGQVIGEKIGVSNIDRKGPTLTGTSLSEGEWTNQDVTVTLSAADLQENGGNGVGLLGAPYSYDGGITYSDINTFVSTQNEIKEIYLQDQLGNISISQVNIHNIDKLPPQEISMELISEGWQNEEVCMEALGVDQEDGCGLHKEAYSLDGENWQESPQFFFQENGEYSLYVRDSIENQDSIAFQVNNMDKTSPTIIMLKANEETMKWDQIEFTIIAQDLQPDGSEGSGLHEEAYSIDGGKTFYKTPTFIIREKQIFDIVVRDTFLQESQTMTIKRDSFPYPEPEEEEIPKVEKKPEPIPVPEGNEEADQEPTEEDKKDWDRSPYAFAKEGFGKVEPCPLPEITNVMMDDQIMVSKEEERNILHRPWYKTKEGIAIITCTGIIGSLLFLIWLLWLFLFSVKVYSLERKKKIKCLGWVMLRREEKGYSIWIPNFMIHNSTTGNYRMKVSKWIMKRAENAPLLIECEEKSVETMIQETIDFAL